MPQSQRFSTNLGLSQTPEIDQRKFPEIYAELQRIRNAMRLMQSALDTYTGALSEDPAYWSQSQAGNTIRIAGIARVYCIASDAIALGELVNFWDNAGVATAQLADAVTPTPAMAFCSTADGVAVGEFGEFVLIGAMPYFTGLPTGTILYLSGTPGQITATAPPPGNLIQQIGFPVTPDTIFFNPAGQWSL